MGAEPPPLDSDTDRELSPVDETLLQQYDKQTAHSSRASSSRPVGRPPKPKCAPVNARDKAHGRTHLHRAAAKGDLARVIDLIERGADVAVADNAGVYPLHEACLKGNAHVAAFLLSKGAAINARDCEGDYPLLDAAQNDHLEVCKVLLEAGANPTLRNTAGSSALSEAEEGPVKELLRQYSDRFDAPGQNRMKISDIVEEVPSPQRSARIRKTQLSVDSRGARSVDRFGRDQLHNYVLEGEDELTEEWLEIIGETDFQDYEGDTPLHSAARQGNAHMTGLLLDRNAKVSIRNKLGRTALHEACTRPRNREVILLLLDAGASLLVPDFAEQRPLDIARAVSGAEASETRILAKATEQEQAELQRKEKRRMLKSSGSLSRRSSASSGRSPKLEREDSITPRKKRKYTRRIRDDEGDSAEPPEVALTLHTSQPIEVIKTVAPARTAMEMPTFLTELKTHCAPRMQDSSVRGEPLASRVEPDPSPRQTPVLTGKDKEANEQALLQMGRELMTAMEKQTAMLAQVLTGIQQIVQQNQ